MSEITEGLTSPLTSRVDDAYFDEDARLGRRSFDVRLLHEPVSVFGTRSPVIVGHSESATEAMRQMKAQHRGCVLITEGGTANEPLLGIFTERDILLKIIGCGRNPAEIQISEVMSVEPESLQADAQVAWVLNMMSVGGFRHVPIVNARGWPVGVISVRDVVAFLVEAFPSEILNLPPDFGVNKCHPRDGA